MPMSCDILKIEHFLKPGTIIVVDGRAANSRFIKKNLQRNWTERVPYFHGVKPRFSQPKGDYEIYYFF